MFVFLAPSTGSSVVQTGGTSQQTRRIRIDQHHSIAAAAPARAGPAMGRQRGSGRRPRRCLAPFAALKVRLMGLTVSMILPVTVSYWPALADHNRPCGSTVLGANKAFCRVCHSLMNCLPRSHTMDGSDEQIVEGAVALTLGGTYLFFCTGHFCEFAGLQYTAGLRLTASKHA